MWRFINYKQSKLWWQQSYVKILLNRNDDILFKIYKLNDNINKSSRDDKILNISYLFQFVHLLAIEKHIYNELVNAVFKLTCLINIRAVGHL